MTSTFDVLREIDDSLQTLRLPAGKPLLIGLSGGIDSQVLTHALVQSGGADALDLRAVHIDHGIRPSSSEDADRTREFCHHLGIECEVIKVDVEAWDAHLRQGTEAAARAARYAAFAEVAKKTGADTVATGHTLDDQAETVMLRLISGSGLEGLGAMSMITRRDVVLEPGANRSRNLRVFRPLLSVRRSEIERYADAHDLTPIEDESNASLSFRRNAIRQKVFPVIEEIEPTAKEGIARTASLLRDDAMFISDTLDETFANVVAERGDLWMIERQQFRQAHESIQRRLLLRTIDPLVSERVRLGQERIEALRDAAVNGRPGVTIELAERLVAYVDYDRVAIGDADSIEDDLRKLSWVPLLEPGTEMPLSGSIDVPLGNGWRVVGTVGRGNDWTLRTRRDGDRVRNRRGKVIKVQDWLVDRRVPRYVRDWLPIVARGGEIQWIIGLDLMEYVEKADDVSLHLELDLRSS